MYALTHPYFDVPVQYYSDSNANALELLQPRIKPYLSLAHSTIHRQIITIFNPLKLKSRIYEHMGNQDQDLNLYMI